MLGDVPTHDRSVEHRARDSTTVTQQPAHAMSARSAARIIEHGARGIDPQNRSFIGRERDGQHSSPTTQIKDSLRVRLMYESSVKVVIWAVRIVRVVQVDNPRVIVAHTPDANWRAYGCEERGSI